MGTPSWLYYLFGGAMLAVAAYSTAQLVVSVRLRDPAGRDVDLAHLLMGVTMAGMFVPAWAFGPSWLWELAFFALLVWFVTRTAVSVQRFGLHVPHEGIHAAMSLAMVLMYLYPMGASGVASMSMSGSSSSHGILDPGIGLILAFVFFASAIFTLASPDKGASHHGVHHPHRSLALARVSQGHGPAEDTAPPAVAERPAPYSVLRRPELEDVSHVVMCLGMGFMLILML